MSSSKLPKSTSANDLRSAGRRHHRERSPSPAPTPNRPKSPSRIPVHLGLGGKSTPGTTKAPARLRDPSPVTGAVTKIRRRDPSPSPALPAPVTKLRHRDRDPSPASIRSKDSSPSTPPVINNCSQSPILSNPSTPVGKTSKRISPALLIPPKANEGKHVQTTSSGSSKNIGIKRLEALARSTAPIQGSPLKRGRNGEPIFTNSGSSLTSCSIATGAPWVQKYLPRCINDHFVHKRKIEEFQNWLNSSSSRGTNMCILTGPAGVGKTATVHLVANELGYLVREWLNPMDLNTWTNPDDAETLLGNERSDDTVRGKSQIDTFTDFLLRVSTFNCLPIKSKSQATTKTKKLVLVEDFPSFFVRETHLLHQLIRNYKTVGECPLIFVLSDSTSMDSNANKLFPKSLLSEVGVRHIEFNPIASTFLNKFLSNILSQENINVDKSVIDEIVAASAGDMRWAINNLQFRLQKPKAIKGTGSSALKKQPKKKESNKTGSRNKIKADGECGRDESIYLFHAIGKVVYSKRDPNIISEVELKLPAKYIKDQRLHPTIEIPEQIGQKVGANPETFFHFLGQNYLSYFSSLDDIVRAAGYMSDANYIFSSWVPDGGSAGGTGQNYKNLEIREEFGLSVAIRGLMHSNTARVGSSFRPMKKPAHTELITRIRTMRDGARSLFRGTTTRDDFFPDLFPYYNNRHFASKLNPHQSEFVKKYGPFQSYGSLNRGGKQNLEVGEAVEIDDTITGEDVEGSFSSGNGTFPVIPGAGAGVLEEVEGCQGSIEPNPDSEDEYKIEDFDEE